LNHGRLEHSPDYSNDSDDNDENITTAETTTTATTTIEHFQRLLQSE
jgi:hypothetical protein